jgi:hypothetical protein
MSNKYNKKKNNYAKNKSRSVFKADGVLIEVVSETGSSTDDIFLVDRNGIMVSFPKALIRVNDLKIINGKISISPAMYDTWFKPKIDLEIAAASQKLYDNFGKLVKNSNLILNDKEFYRIRLPFLKSTILYSVTIKYPLGKLLESWINEEDLEIRNGIYMLKMNVAPLSGTNNYTAYSMARKTLVKGSLGANDKHWKSFIDEFYSMENREANESELLVLTRLLNQLNID